MPAPMGYLESYLAAYRPYKDYWNYEDGCVLLGCVRLYQAAGEERFRDFALTYLERFVAPDGSIPNYEREQYNIDSIQSGKALFFALDETGDGRYRRALAFHRERLAKHPRCQCGSFWHKTIYPWQIWLDGLYMAQPFLLEYGLRFGEPDAVKDVIAQLQNARRLLYDERAGLSSHGYDEARAQPWANQETGHSPSFWLRSMGWYLMALADCAALLRDGGSRYEPSIRAIFREATDGMLRYRDARSGLFWQVIDRPDVPGNYTETSGSAMVAYALMRGARTGALDADRAEIGLSVLQALTREKLVTDGQGHLRLKDICHVAGLGPGAKRDGSVGYYLSEKRVCDDPKGVGPYMMALAEASFMQPKKGV